MELEYLEDPGSATPRVLLMYGGLPNEVGLLLEALGPLAAGEEDRRVEIEALSGFHGIEDCSLICEVGDSSLGVHLIDETRTAFHCTLTDSGWSRVCGLLEPFAQPLGNATSFIST